jgi:hypothetical protein
MGFPFRRRSSGISSRSPPKPQGQGEAVPPRAARSEEMILAQRPAAPSPAGLRMLFWLGIAATIAAGVVYLAC